VQVFWAAIPFPQQGWPSPPHGSHMLGRPKPVNEQLWPATQVAAPPFWQQGCPDSPQAWQMAPMAQPACEAVQLPLSPQQG
jgi:hypothetical protein